MKRLQEADPLVATAEFDLLYFQKENSARNLLWGVCILCARGEPRNRVFPEQRLRHVRR